MGNVEANRILLKSSISAWLFLAIIGLSKSLECYNCQGLDECKDLNPEKTESSATYPNAENHACLLQYDNGQVTARYMAFPSEPLTEEIECTSLCKTSELCSCNTDLCNGEHTDYIAEQSENDCEQPEENPEEKHSEETKPEESDPEANKAEENNPEENTPDENKPEESNPEEIKQEESNPEEKPEENKPEENNPEETKPEASDPEENN